MVFSSDLFETSRSTYDQWKKPQPTIFAQKVLTSYLEGF